MNIPSLKELYKGELSWLQDSIIILGLAGSHSYGLATPESDIDLRGLCIPPRQYFHGFNNTFEQVEGKDEDKNIEFCIYEIRKFLRLCAVSNPNITELLWLDPADYLTLTPAGEKIIAARDNFLCKEAMFRFVAYSVGQVNKIKSHRHWLLNPMKVEPKREDYGLPKGQALITHDQRGAMDNLIEKGSIKENELSPNFIQALAKEKGYFQAHRQWEQYQGWLKTRNKKRAALEAKWGYDLKHASHVVRLLKMCREIAIEHRVIVKRHDREEILAVKNGAWSYEQLLEWAEQQKIELDELYKTSTLRAEVDMNWLDNLCIEIVEEHLRNNY